MLVLSGRVHETILVPGLPTAIQVMAIQSGTVRLGIEPTQSGQAAEASVSPLPQFHQMVDRRLAITGRGLTELRRHLEAGEVQDAALILEKIEEDLTLLRRRLYSEVEPTAAAPALYSRTLSQSN
jgi:hypothetical protein